MSDTPSTVIEPFSAQYRSSVVSSLDDHPEPLPLELDRLHPPDSVDVALHDVPTHRVACAKGRLEIHRSASPELAERRSRERLGNRVKREARRLDDLGGEADAVDRDGAADIDERRRYGCIDLEPKTFVTTGDGGDGADLPDDACEHAGRLLHGAWT